MKKRVLNFAPTLANNIGLRLKAIGFVDIVLAAD